MLLLVTFIARFSFGSTRIHLEAILMMCRNTLLARCEVGFCCVSMCQIFCQETNTDLHEGIHSKDGKVWVTLCIVDEIQIHQLLELQIFGLHAVDHICKQHRHILANSHSCNDLLHCIFLLVLHVHHHTYLFIHCYRQT